MPKGIYKRIKPTGFALLDPEERRKITSKGGKAAHAAGTAHRWTSEEAVAAGRKGGRNRWGERIS
jgi:general stress protein YciG